MEIKDILFQRRKELNMTMKQVADKVGVSEGTISRWESGKIADMRRDKIMAYAQALNISPAIIMGWDNVDSSSTSESIHAGKRIPVLGSVAAGIPIDAIEDVLDWEDISEDMAKTGEFFGLRIKGDSMQPRIVEGDSREGICYQIDAPPDFQLLPEETDVSRSRASLLLPLPAALQCLVSPLPGNPRRLHHGARRMGKPSCDAESLPARAAG